MVHLKFCLFLCSLSSSSTLLKRAKLQSQHHSLHLSFFFFLNILCGCSWEKHKIFKKLKSLSKRKLPSVLTMVCFAMKTQSGFKYYPGMPTVWSHYSLAGKSWNVTCGAIMLYWLDESQRVLGSKPHSSNGLHESFGTTCSQLQTLLLLLLRQNGEGEIYLSQMSPWAPRGHMETTKRLVLQWLIVTFFFQWTWLMSKCLLKPKELKIIFRKLFVIAYKYCISIDS